MTALPDVSGVRHPATWPSYPHRWFGRFVIRRRFDVAEHGAENVPADGPVILAANHIGVADGPLLGLFGPRRVHVPTDPGAVRTHLRVLADGHAVGVFPDGTRGGEVSRFHRGAAYLAMVSGAPVVPVTIFWAREPGADTHAAAPRGGRVDIVYGAPYRTAREPLAADQEARRGHLVRPARAHAGRAGRRSHAHRPNRCRPAHRRHPWREPWRNP